MENEGARVGVAYFTQNTLRIVVGFLFWFHGLQKMFGAFGWGEPVDLMSRMGLAGVLELVGGPLIMLGLFTRPVAFLLAGEMAFVYFIAHYPRGFGPSRREVNCRPSTVGLSSFLPPTEPGRSAWTA